MPDGSPALARSPEDLRAEVAVQAVDAKPSFFRHEAQLPLTTSQDWFR